MGITNSAASQPAVPSPDGTLIATIFQSNLVLRSSSDGQSIRSYSLLPTNSGSSRKVKWSYRWRDRGSTDPLRILVANDDTIQAFEKDNAHWKAIINGPTGNTGGIAGVGFGVNEDEILVFSDFGVKATVWSLLTSRGIEIRDPKAGSKRNAYRPMTRHWAILTRETARDALLILAPNTYEVLENVELPTVDAQGLKWSPDGRWLTIWDASGAGYRVFIFTADGHLYKTYVGGQTADNVGLGVRNVTWNPNGETLAIGDYDDRITILSNNTFYPRFAAIHTSNLDPDQTEAWEEQIQNSQSRSYVRVRQPIALPSQSSLFGKSDSITGISLMEFNRQGTLLATRSDTTPSTLWVWSLISQNLVAILIHHAAIRSIQWHPTIDDMLLIHCALDFPIVHIWKSNWNTPKVLSLHLDTVGGRIEACWLFTEASEHARLMIGNASNYSTASMRADGELLAPTNPVEAVDQGPDNRFDQSLIDFSPVKSPHEDSNGYSDQWGVSDDVDDTFQFCKARSAIPI